jgi:branched-chain amino acid transport system permease protein
MLAQQLFNALVLGSVYALFSLGFTLTFGVLRIINLLYGFYFVCGAFAALLAVKTLGAPIWLAGIAGTLVAGVVGLLLDTAMLRPLRAAKAPELSSLVVSLGGVLLFNNLMTIWFGAEVRRFPVNVLTESSIALGPIQVSAIRAVAENADAAALMGVNVGAIVATVSFLSAALAGAAGILIGLNFNAIEPYMGEAMMLRGFVVIIVGGLGDIRGALIAGLALGALEVMTAGYVSSDLKEAVAFAALVLTLWIRPSGLFGRAVVRRA